MYTNLKGLGFKLDRQTKPPLTLPHTSELNSSWLAVCLQLVVVRPQMNRNSSATEWPGTTE